jgi:hypothetical protein
VSSKVVFLPIAAASAELLETVDALSLAARDPERPLLGIAYVAVYGQREYGLGIKGAAKDEMMRTHSMVELLAQELIDRIRGLR